MNKPTPRESQADLDYSFAVDLMKYLVVPTFVLDATGHVLIWNKALERLTGVTAEAVLGTRNHWQAFYESPRPCLADVFIEHREQEMSALYLIHESDGTESHGIHAENWCLMPQIGESRYLAIDAGPIYGQDGQLLAVIETMRDMTPLKQAQDQLEALATQDGLTRIANRRAFDDRLDREWRRALREKNSMALLMIDVDHFKRYNDTYGHQAGDACLGRVAEALKSVLKRPGDFVARYGGEEFAVILPDVNSPGAKAMAALIVDAVRNLKIPHRHNDAQGVVTVSVGVSATGVPPHISAPDLLKCADDALYKAKADGRDGWSYVKHRAAPATAQEKGSDS